MKFLILLTAIFSISCSHLNRTPAGLNYTSSHTNEDDQSSVTGQIPEMIFKNLKQKTKVELHLSCDIQIDENEKEFITCTIKNNTGQIIFSGVNFGELRTDTGVLINLIVLENNVVGNFKGSFLTSCFEIQDPKTIECKFKRIK